MSTKKGEGGERAPSPHEATLQETVLIDDSGLAPHTSKESLVQYCKSLWKSRHFVTTYAITKANAKGRDRYLGNLWLVLDPLFQVSVYALIFGLILQVDRGMNNFIGFLVIGVIYFNIFSQGITGGSNLIQKSRALITSFRFPRAAIPVSSTIRSFIDNLIPCLLAIIVAVAFQLDEPFHWTIIFVIPLYFLAHVFTLGTIFIGARLTAFVPDLQSVISLLSRGLFFLSGIFFDVSRFDTSPFLQKFVEANPIYQFLMAIRSCVLDGAIPSAWTWGYLSLWSFGLMLTGFILFYQREEHYALVK